MDFLTFKKSNFVKGKFLKIRFSINLSWGHARSHTKIGPDQFSRFDVSWIQTNKQTSMQSILYKSSRKSHPLHLTKFFWEKETTI